MSSKHTPGPTVVWTGSNIVVEHRPGWTYYKGFAGSSYHGAEFDIRAKTPTRGSAFGGRVFETVEVDGRRGNIAKNEAIEKAKQIDANFAKIMADEEAAILADEEKRQADNDRRHAEQLVRDAAPDLLVACEEVLANACVEQSAELLRMVAQAVRKAKGGK